MESNYYWQLDYWNWIIVDNWINEIELLLTIELLKWIIVDNWINGIELLLGTELMELNYCWQLN